MRLMGVEYPDSVAEHSCNAAQIGYILAHMAGADANKVAAMLIRHDMAETRIGDLHKIAARYIHDKKQAEHDVMQEQYAWLPGEEDLHGLFREYEEKTTLEGQLAKDADYLEQAFQAKVYLEQGHAAAQDRIDNVGRALRTPQAKQLREKMLHTNSYARWQEAGLKNV